MHFFRFVLSHHYVILLLLSRVLPPVQRDHAYDTTLCGFGSSANEHAPPSNHRPVRHRPSVFSRDLRQLPRGVGYERRDAAKGLLISQTFGDVCVASSTARSEFRSQESHRPPATHLARTLIETASRKCSRRCNHVVSRDNLIVYIRHFATAAAPLSICRLGSC